MRLPVQLQRAMAAEAEATREARAKVCTCLHTVHCTYSMYNVLHCVHCTWFMYNIIFGPVIILIINSLGVLESLFGDLIINTCIVKLALNLFHISIIIWINKFKLMAWEIV